MATHSIGQYEIVRRLGAGGMGEVYLARDPRLERDVALKLLPESLHQDLTARERFLREARAASKLSHPNIITIYAIESFDGRDGIVMEYIDGPSLDRFRAEPDRTMSALVDVALQIAEGLAAAHAAGVVHRDLKPSNVLIDRAGRARILDFGLALVGRGARITRDGTLVGSPAYMSPEQIRGLDIDHRSDIFSFGIVLYELLSGVHPFWSEQEAAILFAIVNDQPSPLTSRISGLSADWDSFLARTLAKDADTRFPTTSEMVSSLRSLALNSGYFDPASPRSTSQFVVGQIVTAPRTPSLAVLPMVDLSPEQDQEYFCDGLSEELINALSRIPGLNVVARTSAFSFKGQPQDVRQIGDRLGATSVLEGSVRKHGNRLRISAQLVNVADGYQLWSERFDRDAGDIFAIQDEIAQTVAERLRLKLGSLPSAPTHDVEAYNLYLLGRFHWNKRTTESMRRALECFEGAVERDASFALAYAGIADSLLILEDHGFIGYRDAIARARAAVEKALSLDDNLAEAHTSLGGIYAELRQFEKSGEEFRRAIQLKPGYATAHHWYATQMLLEVGRIPKAEREIIRAYELDPLSLIINTDLGRHYYYMRDFAKAEVIVGRALSLDSHFVKARRLMFLILWQSGQYEAAVAQIPHWLPAYTGLPEGKSDWPQILANSGFPGVLRQMLKVMSGARMGYPLHYAIATTHAQLGDLDVAVAVLAENTDQRSPNFAGLRMDALLDPLRSHLRFVDLLKSLGI